MNETGWTHVDEAKVREEIEKRFRERTPPHVIADADWRYRVPRSEVRDIELKLTGKLSPLYKEFLEERAAWYRQMAKNVAEERR